MVPSLAAWSIPDRTAFGIFAGLLAAAANTAVAVGGAPFGMYVALKHWLPNRARGAMAVFFFCICSFSVILQGSTGMFSLASVSLIVAGIVGCAAGQIAGVYCGRGIDARIFHRLLMFFLVLAVCFLFFKAFFI
jgi:Ni,Fe-hydrogenase I cytochrome b subunit